MCNCDSSCTDYTEGYDRGFEDGKLKAELERGYDTGYTNGVETGNAMLLATAGERDEERAKRHLVDSQRKTVLSLLEAALRIIKAHQQVNEGDALAAVEEDIELLESARLL